MKYEAAISLRLLAEVEASRNADQTAESRAGEHFRESIEALEKLGAEGDLALACAGYGRLCCRQGGRAQAREQLARALSIIERLGIVGEAERVRAELEAVAVR